MHLPNINHDYDQRNIVSVNVNYISIMTIIITILSICELHEQASLLLANSAQVEHRGLDGRYEKYKRQNVVRIIINLKYVKTEFDNRKYIHIRLLNKVATAEVQTLDFDHR